MGDHIPDANCSGVKGVHCSVDAPGAHGYVMATFFFMVLIDEFHNHENSGTYCLQTRARVS